MYTVIINVWYLFRSMQEVQLDKLIKLLDSPGIVMATGNSDAATILRNCVKVCSYFSHSKKSIIMFVVLIAK